MSLRRLIAIRTLLTRRLVDDGGHVGILMALALFVVVGMLMMTWNTAQLSKEKMRLQNAADSAALGFCTWQARGMNAVQNINDEMYVALSLADKLLSVATGFEAAALASEALENIPYVGVVFKITAQAFHIIALLTGGMSGLLASRICPWILRPFSYFYAYGSAALGWWSALQLAGRNLADPLGNVSIDFASKWGGKLGLYAVGVSYPFRDTVALPIGFDDESASKTPWKRTKDLSGTFTKTHYSIYKTAHKICGTGKPWELKPWISKRGDKKGVGVTPGPSVWIAHKYYDHIETLPLDAWQAKFGSKGVRKMPMLAVAAAQCISGDIVPHSKKPSEGAANNRRAGFGTGATAKLIPVATAFGALNSTVGKAVGMGIYH